MSQKRVGDFVEPQVLESIQGAKLSIPRPGYLVHLQFRRFAGCPICNLHLQSFIQRHPEITESRIQEIAVFHSSKDSMLEYQREAPFPFIADPDKKLYEAFGVGESVMAVLDPRAWPGAIGGLVKKGVQFPSRGESPLGLPADFLIGDLGEIVAVKYGTHADDQWTFDEVLALARSTSRMETPTAAT